MKLGVHLDLAGLISISLLAGDVEYGIHLFPRAGHRLWGIERTGFYMTCFGLGRLALFTKGWL